MKKSLFSLLLFSAVVASAQKVSNKISLQKGQTVEVTTNMNMNTQSLMGEMPANIIFTDTYLVTDASDAGIQLLKTPKKIKMSMTMMGQEMNIDSDNPKDLEGRMGAPIKEIMKQKQEFTIDAIGLITSVKESDTKKKGSDQGDMMAMMMPGLSNNAVLVVGQGSVFKVLPNKEVAKGDTWTDSTNTKGASGTTAYTVKDITATDIVLDYTGTGQSKTTQSMMGMTADVAADSKISGTVTIDKVTGLMKQKTMTTNTTTNMNMNGNPMESTTKSTAVVTMKVL